MDLIFILTETRETLGVRAGCAAKCILALNQQLDLLLSALPADEGDEEHLEALLEALNKENISAGTRILDAFGCVLAALPFSTTSRRIPFLLCS